MKTIAYHSYKGGTGKTTLAVNLSAHLASKGYNVLLIDMDVYAPSLYVYFNIQPKKWINDYLNEKISFAESIYDFSHIVKELSLQHKIDDQYGSLHAIFSNPSKQEITDLDSFTRKELSKSQSLKKCFISKKQKIPKLIMIILFWIPVLVSDIGQLIHWQYLMRLYYL